MSIMPTNPVCPVEIPDDPRRFGEWVAQMRELLGWNQSELAERSGLAPNQISRLESGDRDDPRLSTVLSIRAAFANAAKVHPPGSLSRFLESEIARELQITPQERETLLRAAWPGPAEPPQQAWADLLRAIRSLAAAHTAR